MIATTVVTRYTALMQMLIWITHVITVATKQLVLTQIPIWITHVITVVI